MKSWSDLVLNNSSDDIPTHRFDIFIRCKLSAYNFMSVLFSFSLELQKASQTYTINSTKIETISFYSFIFYFNRCKYTNTFCVRIKSIF